ncbi:MULTISPECIES: hypothetical protein [unclassified Polaribacter]|jgi:hypothetical protein|uniref:hypothetical protein n=1 Tax=unclassified Polaribacter TaxID=196858 RepID=UPI001C4F63C1|nr:MULTISPECIES: hypothetical protein [unclassified Polaribacter]QXP63023.1 hypothetical protein H0I27_14345 [Polaribacter sp. HaHaR_3_91]QXP65532.1 hypothetical protein H0I28_09900 [Polaribacter sp. AHE13PA]
MKKVILFLVFSVAMSSSIFAQEKMDKKIQKKVDSYVETVASKITLSKEEKEKLIVIKTEQTISSSEITAKYKGTPELKEQRKASNKKFSKDLIKAFGKERALEIKKASRKNKKKKE